MTKENQFEIDNAFRMSEGKPPVEQKREYTFTIRNKALFDSMVNYIKNNGVQASGKHENNVWTLTLVDQDAFDQMNRIYYNYLMFSNG